MVAERLNVPVEAVFLRPISDPGVSSDIESVEVGPNKYVLKSPRERLATAKDFKADTSRLWNEVIGLAVASRTVSSDHSPTVVAASLAPRRPLLTCPSFDALNLRKLLLERTVDTSRLCEQLGEWLAGLHNLDVGILGVSGVADLLFNSMVDMRIRSFYVPVARSFPGARDRVLDAIGHLNLRDGYVHGDFSPKNILVSENLEDYWVLDFEGFHIGSGAFDVASVLHHLVLKALRRRSPDPRAILVGTESLLRAYETFVMRGPGFPDICSHTAILLLSRIVGLSPATYLTGEDRRRTVQVGLRLLDAETPTRGALLRCISDAVLS